MESNVREEDGMETSIPLKKLKQHEQYLKFLVKMKMHHEGLPITHAPVGLGLIVFYPVPDRWSKSKQQKAFYRPIRHRMRPDIDNVKKTVMDALNGTFYQDDSQVVELFYVRTLYAQEVGVHLLLMQRG